MWAGTSHKVTEPKTVEALFCCFHSVTPVWKLSQTDHPSWFQHTEKIIFCITQHAKELPQFFFFLHLHTKALAVLRPCVRPILQHTAVPISPSTKPSANLLPNSFCYPTITPQAPWIPGTRPESGTVLNKKTQTLRHTGEIGWTFLLHQPIQRHGQKRRQETNVFGKQFSPSAPTIMQPSSRMLK